MNEATAKCAGEGERVLVNARGVARMLGLSPRQVWRLLSAGRIPKPVRIGRSVRWRTADLARWIEADCPKKPEDSA